MARARPTAPMRQPRHQHGEGGSARLYGSSAVPHSRERKEGTLGSGQRNVLPWSDEMEHAGEGAAGESEEMTMNWLRTERSMTLSDCLQCSL